MPRGEMAASTPPQTMASAAPCWRRRRPSPMLWAPVAQAVLQLWLGPRRPCSRAMWPAARLGRILGAVDLHNTITHHINLHHTTGCLTILDTQTFG